jgi:hypothetical protein
MAYELWGARVLLDQGDSYCSKGNGAHDDEDKTRCGNIDASGTKGLEGRPSQENMEDTTAKKKMQSAAVYSRPASPEKLQSTIDWADEMQDLLDRGLVNNHPVHELEGKWDGIIRGLGMLQRGEVRGCKLVVRMYET